MTSDGETSGGEAPVQTLRRRAAQGYDESVRLQERDERIEGHLWLVRHVAQKMSAKIPNWITYDDLYSAGVLGLVTVARDFDPTRQTEFSTYAYARIRGSMLDDLRSRSFASSNVHSRMRRIRSAYESIAGVGPEGPMHEDVAQEAGLTMEEYYRTLDDARRQTFVSICGLTEDEPSLANLLPTSREEDPAALAERKDRAEMLARATMELPEKERKVVLLYYKEDLNMKEIGSVLGVNESRVSQLHSSALLRLSVKLRRKL